MRARREDGTVLGSGGARVRVFFYMCAVLDKRESIDSEQGSFPFNAILFGIEKHIFDLFFLLSYNNEFLSVSKSNLIY